MREIVMIALFISGCNNVSIDGDYTCVLNTADISINATISSHNSDTLTIRSGTMDSAISKCKNKNSDADSVWCTCTREWIIGIF